MWNMNPAAWGMMGAMGGGAIGARQAVGGRVAIGAPAKRAADVLAAATGAKKPKVGNHLNAAFQMAQAQQPAAASEDDVYRGEVRFSSPEAVQQALLLHGTDFMGSTIGVELDEKSKDGTKVIVTNILQSHGWQDLKDHFGTCGTVVFTNVAQATGTPCVGQVRFASAVEAQQALLLNGTILAGYQIEVKMHAGSKDQTKLQVSNLAPGLEWQELKDIFKQNGLTPVFVETTCEETASTAEVRYQEPAHAMTATQMLNGSVLAGSTIIVEMDPNSKDQSMLRVKGVPPGIDWQELKDHFNQIGQVAFVEVHKGTKVGKPGGGKGAGMGAGMGAMAAMGGMAGAGAMGKKGGGAAAAGGGGAAQMMAAKGMGKMLPNGMFLTANGVIMSPDQLAGMGGCMGGGMGGGMGAVSGMGMAAGSGGKGKGKGAKFAAAAGGGGLRGEVRFAFKMHAELAVQMANGQELRGETINVALDTASADGTKIIVTGLAPGTGWQDIKDYFGEIGQVAFANVTGG